MGLDSVELLLAVEAAFGILIPDEDAAVLETPRQLAHYVVNRCPMGTVDKDLMLRRVIELTAEVIDIPVDQIKPDHHFVRDLGMG